MPAKDAARPYIRCRDLDGQLWTLPPEAGLWQALLPAAIRGEDIFIPIDLIRGVIKPEDSDAAETLQGELWRWQQLEPEQQQIQVYPLYRLGQWARLQRGIIHGASSSTT